LIQRLTVTGEQNLTSRWRKKEMARQPRIFRYFCPKCGVENTATCKHCKTTYRFDPVKQPGEKLVLRHILFGERQWQRMVARAKVTPGINGPSEFVRMACDEVLSMPPHRLFSL
jgi:predicted RNA-binding Zn-ribbon protein involved in translation (DUF1610 family)